jgi:hypothetical protein
MHIKRQALHAVKDGTNCNDMVYAGRHETSSSHATAHRVRWEIVSSS